METYDREDDNDRSPTQICEICGHEDRGKYCSECGSKLEFLGNVKSSSIQNLKSMLSEYVGEVLDPVFAYVKTTLLLLVFPERFFQTLHLRNQAIQDIDVGILTSLWRKIPGTTAQHTINPVAYFASNVFINFISNAIIVASIVRWLLGWESIIDTQINDFVTTTVIPNLISASLFSFLYMLAAAFIFDTLTNRSKISPRLIYSFWTYMFSLVWVGPVIAFSLVVSLIIIFFTIILVILAISDQLVQAGVPNTMITEQLTVTIVGTFMYFLSVLFLTTILIARIYTFVVIPWKVFSKVFPREQFNPFVLGVKLAVSLLVPIIIFRSCIVPFLVPLYFIPLPLPLPGR
jgi:hypothetical protein